MRYRVCTYRIIDIPDGGIDGEKAGAAEIAEDARWLIDGYARESYCPMAEMAGEDE